MLTLQLIRHAKTHQQSHSGKDIHRDLMEKGIAQANMLGNYLQLHHIELGNILCSPSNRTRQTQSIICHHLAEMCSIEVRDSLYHASKDTLLSEIQNGKGNALTIIGHNDGISEFAAYLTDEFISMKTCEMITIAFPFKSWDMVSAGTGIISLRYRPEVFLP